MRKIVLLFSILLYFSCKKSKEEYYLIAKRDDKTSLFAYYDKTGKKILGDYFWVYEDTLKTYGIVADSGYVLINRNGEKMYSIYSYDNGPDSTSEGVYRIIKDGKIGYADSLTSKIIIEPQYDCAYPFENGKAKVSKDCKISIENEHIIWESKKWFFIDKKGRKIK